MITRDLRDSVVHMKEMAEEGLNDVDSGDEGGGLGDEDDLDYEAIIDDDLVIRSGL